MIELRGDQGRGVGIEHLVDRRHHPHRHQLSNYLAGFNAHFARQIADRDHFRYLHHPLARPRNRDLGFSQLFSGQCALLFRYAPCREALSRGIPEPPAS